MSDVLRNEPKQKRAKTTLDKLRKAALDALAVHGRDRFTTAMVAERAGVSIGTVYRYYPDRVAALEDVQPIEGGIDKLITEYYAQRVQGRAA